MGVDMMGFEVDHTPFELATPCDTPCQAARWVTAWQERHAEPRFRRAEPAVLPWTSGIPRRIVMSVSAARLETPAASMSGVPPAAAPDLVSEG